MSHRGNSYDSGVKERSGWLLPSAVLAAVVVLGFVFLVYYLAPNPASLIEEHTSPTTRTDVVHASVGGVALSIPANYLLYSSARRGGPRNGVALFAALPDFRGYSDADAALFANNSANSPIVHLVIRQQEFTLSERAKLARVYLPQVADTHGTPDSFGLTRYVFRDDSGYRGEDLFVGHTGRGLVVMHCARRSNVIPSPNCLREMPLANDVEMSYRFKLSHLVEWRAIDEGAMKLVAALTKAPR